MCARLRLASAVLFVVALLATPASAESFFFSTGLPDFRIATASRPSANGNIEVESADDFVLTSPTRITDASFTGLLPTGAPLSDIQNVHVEIYRVFPQDSDVGRTSGPPDFSTSNVPTRVNSPSDVAFAERDALDNTLTFKAVNTGFFGQTATAAKSVLSSGIPIPFTTPTGGQGPVTGQPITFTVNFSTPFNLPADHYFFVPQVQLSSGDFLWLSAARPIALPGTPFPPGFTDLQEWIRNEDLAPDWLRVGTDIVGGTTFNATFSLSGDFVPEPASLTMLALGAAAVFAAARVLRPNRPASDSVAGE